MAVKNGTEKVFEVPADTICGILRDPDFIQCLDAEFIEEAIQPDGKEFRYVRKTTAVGYGRNYFIKVRTLTGQQTAVSVVTQSRKVTVLFDPAWKRDVERVFGYIEILLRR